jgi:hypothetical protein
MLYFPITSFGLLNFQIIHIFSNTAYNLAGTAFRLILNNPLAMLHLIFQTNCALVTTPLEMIESSLTNMFGNSYFGALLHFVYINHVVMDVCSFY